MGRRTTYSVLVFHMVVTLCICPSIGGMDRKISSEDLKRSLERIRDGSLFHRTDPQEVITNSIECIEKKCDEITKRILIREVLIRNQYKTIDEPCNTHNEEKLIIQTLKPYFVEDQPFDQRYLDCQNRILDSGKIFCDPFKNLICSSENKCACGSGKQWKIGAKPTTGYTLNGIDEPPSADTCIIPLGRPCFQWGSDRRERGLFVDPLGNHLIGDIGVWDQIPSVIHCERTATCPPSFVQDYFRGTICLDDDLDKRLKNLNKYFNEDVKGLKGGEACDFEGHTQLYKSDPLDPDKFDVRLKAMETLQASGAGVCDLQKFHTCGTSGKCECLEPTVLDGEECTLPISARTCGSNPGVTSMVITNGFVPEAQRRLAKQIEKIPMAGCGPKSHCFIDFDYAKSQNDVEMFCICRGFFTGVNCGEPLTMFLPFTRPSSLPSDVKNTAEKLNIFSEFNKLAIKFQEKLTLKSGEKCDFYKELEIRKLIRRIDSLNEPKSVMTKSDYENLTATISKFTETNELYCLRHLDSQRGSANYREHIPYNQPVECEYSSRVCQTPLTAADRSEGQIASSHRRILGTYFSTLGCGEPCTESIDFEGSNPVPDTRFDVDRLENYLNNKTTFCVRSNEVGVRVNCETEKNETNSNCVCRGADADCTRVCSQVLSTSTIGVRVTGPNSTNHGVSHLSINIGGFGWLTLLFLFLALLIQ